MKIFDERLFKKNLRKAKARQIKGEEVILPQEIDRDRFNLFLRLMTAEKPSDISDIPPDTILELYADTYKYVQILECSDALTEERLVYNKRFVKNLRTRRVI